MSLLSVPETGLSLRAVTPLDAKRKGIPVPPQAMKLDLDDRIFEELLKSARVGQKIQLQFGRSPVSSTSLYSRLPATEADFRPPDTTLWIQVKRRQIRTRESPS
jgi:hypothetical protein